MREILEILKAYNGTGYYVILFISSLIYLWFIEEDKTKKSLLVYTPALVQVLFFVPYFYMLYNKLDEGTYYRILWLLPMTVVIAYAGCRMIGVHTKIGLAVLSLILILGGTCVYTGAYMSVAENEYHIPEEVVLVCDMIKPEPGRERVWASFPMEMVHFVRQYTTTIQMPYGREQLVASWDKDDNAMYDIYAQEVTKVEELSECATEYYCNYIILEKERVLIGNPEDVEMRLIGETQNYLVYRNEKVAFWDEQ